MKISPALTAGVIVILACSAAARADEVTVNATSYAIDRVLRCEPYEEYGTRFELELQGLHRNEGTRAQVDVSILAMGDLRIQEVSWSGPEGLFSRQGMPDEQLFELADDRVFGSLRLEDAYGRGDSISFAFDLTLPESPFDCR